MLGIVFFVALLKFATEGLLKYKPVRVFSWKARIERFSDVHNEESG